MTYQFYYDESYQCSAINFRSGNINIDENNNPDFYIGCFIGSLKWEELDQKLIDIENEYKENYFSSETELKSKHLIKTSDTEYGFASLSSRSLKFYQSLFEILDKNVLIHFNVLNKYEEIIKYSIPDAEWFCNHNCSYFLFIYAITKFIKQHPEYKILNILYSKQNNKHKKKKITEILNQHCNKIVYLNKKSGELKAVQDLIYMINMSDFSFTQLPNKLYWNYDNIIKIFKNYCDSMNIVPDKIFIDNHEKTLRAMRKEFPYTVSLDSKNSIRIRACDWIVGLVGRLSLAYDKLLKNDKEIDFTEKLKLLPNECFRTNEEQKEFILSAYNLLLVQQENYWATTTSSFSDCTTTFYTFVRYYQQCIIENIQPTPIGFNTFLIQENIYLFQQHQYNQYVKEECRR